MRKWLYILTTAALVACHSAAPEKEVVDETFVARQALTYEQQRQFDHLYLEAVRQNQKGNYDAQCELLNEALKINPQASEALFDKGIVLLVTAMSSDSLQQAQGDSLIKLAAELEPSNKHMRKTYANRCIVNQDYKTAASLYEKILADRPNEDNLEILVKLYFKTRNWDQALAGLEKYENQYGADESTIYNKFQLYCEMKREKEAFEMVEKHCADNPDDLNFRVLTGDLYMQKDSVEKALKIYDEVLAKDTTNLYAQNSQLNYYNRTQQTEKYQSLIEDIVVNPRTPDESRDQLLYEVSLQSVKNHKSDSTFVLNLYEKTLDNHMLSSAMSELYALYLHEFNWSPDSLECPMRKILQEVPDQEAARRTLLQIYISRQDYDNAKKICQEGQVYQPTVLVYYLYEGVCVSLQGDKKGELDAYRRGVARIDENSVSSDAVELYSAYATALYQQNQKKKAFEMYEKALATDSIDLMTLNNYAYFLAESNEQLDKAEELSKITVDCEPENATFLDTYAWIMYKRKQYRQAKIYIDEALKYEENPDETLIQHKKAIYKKSR